jgi:HK97 gp10 family phage protein
VPDTVTVQVKGLAEIERRLRDLGPRIVRKVLLHACRRGAQKFAAAARAKAPVDTGELKRNITVKTKLDKAKGSAYGIVGVRYKKLGAQDPAVYAMFDEFGRADQAAQPFLRPAFDENKQQALEEFASDLKQEVAKVD